MPREEITYYCNTCGNPYIQKEDAEKCEKSHLLPMKIGDYRYNLADRKKGYPTSIVIHFSNGVGIEYYRKKEN